MTLDPWEESLIRLDKVVTIWYKCLQALPLIEWTKLDSKEKVLELNELFIDVLIGLVFYNPRFNEILAKRSVTTPEMERICQSISSKLRREDGPLLFEQIQNCRDNLINLIDKYFKDDADENKPLPN
jgi:hypothetical protein